VGTPALTSGHNVSYTRAQRLLQAGTTSLARGHTGSYKRAHHL
jgi:hypothetical protein